MKTKLLKTTVAGAALMLGLGFGAREAVADSFSVSVHTPTVSVGFSNEHGRVPSGYVVAHAPVAYCPPPTPVVVHRPVVVHERHVCSFDRRPVGRVWYDRWGHAHTETTFVTVRLCDDYHRHHDHHGHGHYKNDHHNHGHDRDWDRHDHDRHGQKHGKDHGHGRDDHKYGKHDRDDHGRRGHR